jgi:hypothetical protein
MTRPHPKVLFGAVIAALCCFGAGNTAFAGPYGDDMAKCLVRSTSAADREIFLKWLFSAMALNPSIESMVTISAKQRDDIDKNAGTLFQRLLTVSCRSETMDALRYEGPATIQLAFQVFGQAAARDLLSNPRVAEGMKGLGKYLDESKLKELSPDAAHK